MTDDLSKYEGTARILLSKRIHCLHYNSSGMTSQAAIPDQDCITAADAITELVAMVREARELEESLFADKAFHEKRAEAAESELRVARATIVRLEKRNEKDKAENAKLREAVLEEAAKVAIDKADAVSVSKYVASSAAHGAKSMAIAIAAAIRALGKE